MAIIGGFSSEVRARIWCPDTREITFVVVETIIVPITARWTATDRNAMTLFDLRRACLQCLRLTVDDLLALSCVLRQRICESPLMIV
jgi:hypothetical protein